MATGELMATGGLAMLSVSLWTVRVAVTARGNRSLGALVAAIEATVFAAAFSRLLADLDSGTRIAAYGIGVAAGTLIGLRLDGLLNPQLVRVDVVTTGSAVAAALDRAGWPWTISPATGIAGDVDVVSVTLSRQHLRDLLRTIGSVESNPFWTVTSVSQAAAPLLPSGYVQVARRRPDGMPRVRSEAEAGCQREARAATAGGTRSVEIEQVAEASPDGHRSPAAQRAWGAVHEAAHRRRQAQSLGSVQSP